MTDSPAPDAAPALPDGWVWTTIGEITIPVEKHNPADNPDKEIIYLDISSIDNEANIISDPKVYAGIDAPSRARQLVQTEDVLFSTVRTYLKNIALVPKPFDGQIASTGFSVLRASAATIGRYLFYYSLSQDFLERLGRLQRGVSYPAVRDADVRDQSIPLPPLAEQQRIVGAIETLFSQLEAGVRALEGAQRGLRRYRASLLQAACEGRLVPQDPTDEPASELLARILVERRARWEAEELAKLAAKGKSPTNDKWKKKYKAPAAPDTDELPALPNGWVWATVEQVSWDSRYGTSQKCDYEADGPPVLRIPNIINGGISLEDLKFAIDPDGLGSLPALDVNDWLIIRTNGSKSLIGRSALVRQKHESLYFASYLIRYRIVGLPYLAEWLNSIWDSPSLRLDLESIAATSAGQYNVSVSSLNQQVFPLPPLAEQQRIVEEVERRLSVVAELEAMVEAGLTRAARLRQAILQRAFAGQLVPQDPDDEPASALLARLRGEEATPTPRQARLAL